MLSAVLMRAHWRALALMLAMASAHATMLSLPTATSPDRGPCQKVLQAVEDRLRTLEAGLESKSEALVALSSTFDRLFQLLNLDESKHPNGTGYSIDGPENATIIEMVTLGPTDEGGAVEGSALSSDDEDLDAIYKVDVELEQNTPPEDEVQEIDLEGSGLPGDDEDLGPNMVKKGLSLDDEDLGNYLAGSGSGLPGDDEDLRPNMVKRGLSLDDEDLGNSLEGSASDLLYDDEDLETNLEGSG